MPFATYLRRTTGGLTAWCTPKRRRSTCNPWFVQAVVAVTLAKQPIVSSRLCSAGTTALVADQLQRNCIGIELNREYAKMAETRITSDNSLFCQVTRAHTNQSLNAAD
jgi:hypothetical protein